METLFRQSAQSKYFLQKKGFLVPRVGIVLGTGLENLIEHIMVQQVVSYADIPYFPVSTVEFHQGNLVYGHFGNTPVVVMQGRFHYYEGHTMQQVTFPIRVMKELGVQYLLLSNAAGGMNPGYKKGDLVLLEDHINLLPENPLRGLNDPEYGPRFPDMSDPYDKMLRERLKMESARQGVILKSGVYVAVSGPNLETRAEYRFLRMTGADMVGMSTVPEVIVASQIGLPCAAVSVITDECDPDNLKPVDIADIIATASAADKKLSRIFAAVVRAL